MRYVLDIQIDSSGVRQIHNNAQAVTLVRSVVSNPPAPGNLQVAWLAFSPFTNNQVSWVENYSLYATTIQLQAGATLIMTSQTDAPAQPGTIYRFSDYAFKPATQGPPSTYNVQNDAGRPLTFGLASTATINGTMVMAPIHATQIESGQQGTFAPLGTISIYLSSQYTNGVVIDRVAGNALAVPLTRRTPVARIGFNNATHAFYRIGTTT